MGAVFADVGLRTVVVDLLSLVLPSNRSSSQL